MKKKFVLLFLACVIIGFGIARRLGIKDMNSYTQSSIPLSMLEETDAITDIIDTSILLPKEETPFTPIATTTKKVVSKKIIKNSDSITAEAYLVGDLKTGEKYLIHNSSKVFPIASLSKLFTALVNTHILNPDTQIDITEKILESYGDAGHLHKGEKFTAKELLYPLLLESSNDAGQAMAESFGYKEFIDYMNSFALEIGMASTSFKDATGLSPSNVSNANDLFTLAHYLYTNEKPLLEITKLKDYELATTTEHEYHHFISINPFVYYTPFIGGKTGRTDEAKESMVSLFSLNIASSTKDIAVIVLRSQFGEREIDTEKILDLFNKKMIKAVK